MKSGLKTTEFWGKTLTQAGLVAAALSGALEPKWAAVAAAAAEACYSIARGLTKAGSGPSGPA